MTPFTLSTATDAAMATARAAAAPGARFVAGGTDLLQLLQEDVIEAAELVDINGLPFSDIDAEAEGVRIGALCRLADVADDPRVADRWPAVAAALRETASPQVRNMATVGGNLLQRTRCLYFRDAGTPCNKREPGSGCSAIGGQDRMNAVLGGSARCIAAHPSDFTVALLAVDAEITIAGPGGERVVAAGDFHLLPGDTPHRETVLEPGDLVTGIRLPAAWAGASHFVKVRDRTTFEWALASCAAAVRMDGDRVGAARVAVGGVATKPWRLEAVEAALVGRRLDADSIAEATRRAGDGAVAGRRNAFKIPLLRATVACALETIGDRP